MSRRRAELRTLLAGPIGAFLPYKRALGCKYKTEAAALHLLDGYLADQRVVALDQIDSGMIDAFLVSRPRARARSYNHLVGVTRRFFDWALIQGVVERNPVNARPRRVTGQRIPYLFSLDDAKRLLEAARGMPTRPKAPHRALVYEMVFALLYGLGLRVGEVSRLLVGDVDFERATLSVRDTKCRLAHTWASAWRAMSTSASASTPILRHRCSRSPSVARSTNARSARRFTRFCRTSS